MRLKSFVSSAVKCIISFVDHHLAAGLSKTLAYSSCCVCQWQRKISCHVDLKIACFFFVCIMSMDSFGAGGDALHFGERQRSRCVCDDFLTRHNVVVVVDFRGQLKNANFFSTCAVGGTSGAPRRALCTLRLLFRHHEALSQAMKWSASNSVGQRCGIFARVGRTGRSGTGVIESTRCKGRFLCFTFRARFCAPEQRASRPRPTAPR